MLEKGTLFSALRERALPLNRTLPSALPSDSARALRSIDTARLIRRSLRCFVFGSIGLVPLVGVGLAVQSMQLARSVTRESGGEWCLPPFRLYRVVGVALLWFADPVWGLIGDWVLSIFLLLIQSFLCLRRFHHPPNVATWNPGQSALAWGMTMAQVGLSLSLWILAILFRRVWNEDSAL